MLIFTKVCCGIVQVHVVTTTGVEWTGGLEGEQRDYFNVLQW